MPNNNNTDLYIVFYHPNLSIISEKSVRRLLKDISKICHKALIDELEYLMLDLKLDNRQKQSISDRIFKKIEAGSFYYFEDFKRGSALIEISITGLALWLLNTTFGEPIKAAARKSQWLKKVEEILSKKITIKNYLKSRPKELADIASKYIEEPRALNRFEVDKIEYKVTVRHELYVTLKTEETVDIEQVSVKYDNQKLKAEIESEIRKLRSTAKDAKSKDAEE
jgi:hypothetical protein